MSRSKWIVAQWIKYLGTPGLIGVMLAACALAVFFGFILPSEVKLERATNSAADLQNRYKMELANPETRVTPAQSSLTAFYKLLPPEQSAINMLEKIYLSASNESLFLTQGEYKFSREKTGHFGSYQVIFPVRGSYIQIRKFIAKVLNSLPMVALDAVSFKRETIGGTDLEAKIQFTIFFGTV